MVPTVLKLLKPRSSLTVIINSIRRAQLQWLGRQYSMRFTQKESGGGGEDMMGGGEGNYMEPNDILE